MTIIIFINDVEMEAFLLTEPEIEFKINNYRYGDTCILSQLMLLYVRVSLLTGVWFSG